MSVEQGQPVSVTRDEKPIDLGSKELEGLPLTIPDLFAELARSQEEADRVEVKYAPSGYPLRIHVDWMDNAIDDEMTWTMSGFSAS